MRLAQILIDYIPKDTSVLCDNIKQVNTEQLHGLGEVGVGIISGHCSNNRV